MVNCVFHSQCILLFLPSLLSANLFHCWIHFVKCDGSSSHARHSYTHISHQIVLCLIKLQIRAFDMQAHMNTYTQNLHPRVCIHIFNCEYFYYGCWICLCSSCFWDVHCALCVFVSFCWFGFLSYLLSLVNATVFQSKMFTRIEIILI